MWPYSWGRPATGETHHKGCTGQDESGNRRHHCKDACSCDKEHSDHHLNKKGDPAARSASEIEMEES